MKKKSLLTIIACLFALITGLQAHYNNCSCYYVGGTGSINWHNDHEFKDGGTTNCREYDTGFGGSLQLGYECNCWRLELEGLIKYNSLDCLTVSSELGTDKFSASGNTRDIAFLANMYYTFPLCYGFCGYLGGGLGLTFNRLEMDSVDGVSEPSPTASEDELFAWNLMAGVCYECGDCYEFSVGYRFFSTEKVKTPRDGIKSCDIPMIHSIDFGLKIKL